MTNDNAFYPACALSHPGLVRDNNEDSVYVDGRIGLSILCDGMGGYNAGDVASQLAIEVLRREMRASLADIGHLTPVQAVQDVSSDLLIAIENANTRIRQEGVARPEFQGMGTTLVCLVMLEDRAVVAHVGDSRLYRWRKGLLTQITQDHSWLEAQIQAGTMTLEQAQHSRYKNLITRGLGIDDNIEPEIQQILLEDKDIYLSCSDGLSDMIENSEIVNILRIHSNSLEQAAQDLIDAANHNGGRDNISVILMAATPGKSSRGLFKRLVAGLQNR